MNIIHGWWNMLLYSWVWGKIKIYWLPFWFYMYQYITGVRGVHHFLVHFNTLLRMRGYSQVTYVCLGLLRIMIKERGTHKVIVKRVLIGLQQRLKQGGTLQAVDFLWSPCREALISITASAPERWMDACLNKYHDNGWESSHSIQKNWVNLMMYRFLLGTRKMPCDASISDLFFILNRLLELTNLLELREFKYFHPC
jgi:hypothetical protein